MKKYKFNNGATFIETILAMVILAIIIVPFMSAFVFSERGTVEAGDLLDASFVAQRKLEHLQSLNFRDAIVAGNGVFEEEGVFINVTAVPYHPANQNFFNIVASSGDLFVTTPTGRNVLINSNVPTTLQITGENYTVSVPGQPVVLNGSLPASGDVLVMFNATQYTGPTTTLNIQPGGRAVNVHVYDTITNSSTIRVSGVTPLRFTGFTNRTFSMLRARVSVFESLTVGTSPTAVMESILELPN